MPVITSVDPEYWRTHTVGPRPAPNGAWRNDCTPLTAIKHVTHVEAALTIVAAGSISTGLVYDESSLNNERLPVIWISPNDWRNAGGSRYGNVEFVFDWPELIRDKNVYRIEVRTYRPIAFRLLVTSANLDGRFERYDPLRSPGPWRLDAADNTHHWNGDVCLEVMFTESIDLDRCTGVKFCLHHPERCKIDPANCPDRGLEAWQGGALFLAGLIARGISPRKLKLTVTEGGVQRAGGSLADAWHGISRQLSRQGIPFSGTIAAGSDAARAIAVSVLGATSARKVADVRTLSGLFASEDELINEAASAVEAYLSIDAAFPLSRN